MSLWINHTAAYFARGGPFMIPLFILSVVMWALILNRVFYMRSMRRRDLSRLEAWRCIETGQCPDPGESPGAVAGLVRSFLLRRTGAPDLDAYILDEAVLGRSLTVDRHLDFIGVLAAAAPLLGLLGTVAGMITTFDVINLFGAGDANAMAGGISEALITTQTGLLVAIPGLTMKNYLVRRSEIVKQRTASVGMYLGRRLMETGAPEATAC